MAVYPVSNKRQTPQTQPIPGTTQVSNSAGGFSWALDDWGRLRRFLILGSEGGTYYIQEKDLLKENHDVVKRCLKANGRKTVEMIVEVSDKGLAYRNEAALLALALACADKDDDTRKLAMQSLPKVARIGTHLFHWAHYVNAQRGWGRGLKNAVSNWYTSKKVDQLAMQAIKYQQRDGWSHADLLRLAHPRTGDKAQDAVFRWMVGGKDALGNRTVKGRAVPGKEAKDRNFESVKESLPKLIAAFEEAKTCDENRLIALITEQDLPREAIPTQHLNSVKVWDALLVKMPATALIRNLGKITNVGLVKPLSKATKSILAKLKDAEWLKKSRVHPMQFLIASKVYNQGHGEKGKLTWTAEQSVVAALEQAFYASFDNVTPTGKNMLFGMDVSGSMTSMMGGTCLSCCEAEAALALVHLNVEENICLMAFDQGFRELGIRKTMSLVDAMKYVENINGGGTDCSLPFVWARQNKVPIESFIVTTDSETYAGKSHPAQELVRFRQETGINARSVVVGMTSNGFTIGDPNDAGSLDVVGFDASTPSLIADFCRGDI